MSNSLKPHGLQLTRLLCPWEFPGKSTGVGCHFLLQRIFPTQGLNLGLLHCRDILPSEPPGKSQIYPLKLTQCPYSDKGFVKISAKILKYIDGKQRTIGMQSPKHTFFYNVCRSISYTMRNHLGFGFYLCYPLLVTHFT